MGFAGSTLVALLAGSGGACTVSPATPSEPVQVVWDAGNGAGDDGGGYNLGADASACQPGDISTWQPGNYHPAAVPSDACSPADVTGFYDACLGPNATDATCTTFQSASARCYACILTPDTADSYGPIVQHRGFATANIAGCVELSTELAPTPDPSVLACAQAVQALDSCELAACEANCPVTNPSSLASYETCAGAADVSGCQTYESAAACTSALEDGGLANGGAGPLLPDCFLSPFKDFYDRVVPRFCSAAPPAPDGGADGGSGVAPSDAGAATD